MLRSRCCSAPVALAPADAAWLRGPLHQLPGQTRSGRSVVHDRQRRGIGYRLLIRAD